MTDRILAGIELDRNILRYAETEQSGSAYRLLRLGSCVFDFDLEHALLVDPSDPVLKNLSDALGDVLTGTMASELRVVFHAHRTLSFFSVVDAGGSHEQMAHQFLGEARNLYGKSPGPLHIVPTPLKTENGNGSREVEHYYVIVTPKLVFSRLGEMAVSLGIPEYRFLGAASAVSRVVLESKSSVLRDGVDLALAIGHFDGFSEYVLTRNGQLHFTTIYSDHEKAGYAWRIQSVLRRLGLDPARIGQVLGYGTDNIEHTGARPSDTRVLKRLDPSTFLQLEPGGIMSDMKLDRFIPCIGGSL